MHSIPHLRSTIRAMCGIAIMAGLLQCLTHPPGEYIKYEYGISLSSGGVHGDGHGFGH